MWTKEQDDYLIDNYMTGDFIELQAFLGKSKGNITNRATHKHGLKRTLRKQLPNSWTAEKELYLTTNYKIKSVLLMAQELGYCKSAISKKLFSMGLRTRKDKVTNIKSKTNKRFTECLTATQSSRMAVFLTMLSDIKRSSINAGKAVKIDMIELVESYRLVVG